MSGSGGSWRHCARRQLRRCFIGWVLRLGMGRLGALLAALLYLLFPMSIYYGRTFMPEALMILLSVGSLWAFARWVDSGRQWAFALAALVAALCFLVKIPTLYLGFPLVALAWVRWGWRFLLKPVLWLYLVLALAPAVLWYWHANLLFEETGLTFGIWNRYGYDKWDHSLLFTADFYWTLLKRFWQSVYTPAGAVLVLAGLTLAPVQRREWTLWVWMGGLVLYFFFIPEGNRRLHYYQLPFVPVGALLAGRVLEAILGADAPSAGWCRFARNWKHHWRVALVCTLVVGIAAYSAWAIGPYYKQPNNLHNYYQSCHLVGRILDAKLPQDAMMVIGDEDQNAGVPHRAQSPTLLYYCHRKGWQITLDEFTPDRLDSLAAEGADYFLVAVWIRRGERVFLARSLAPRRDDPFGVSAPVARRSRVHALRHPAAKTGSALHSRISCSRRRIVDSSRGPIYYGF